MKKLTQKIKGLKKTTKVDFATYLGVVLAFAAVTLLGRLGLLNRSLTGMLVPICAYIVMAVYGENMTKNGRQTTSACLPILFPFVLY